LITFARNFLKVADCRTRRSAIFPFDRNDVIRIFHVSVGMAYTENVHVLWYFIAVQDDVINDGILFAFVLEKLLHVCLFVFVDSFSGIAQSTVWPSVVTCVGNWFGKGR